MTNRTTPHFWEDYNALPKEIRDVADKNFRLLEESPEHPSLQLKRIDELWSVRAGIGSHAEYDKLVANQ
ncbi:hypothetical protein [Armatimonas sp.]|uniref:hypothetical protein n=1 Tax=Armatimonas sp. TaxID=1872638 RepID=UPI00375254E7